MMILRIIVVSIFISLISITSSAQKVLNNTHILNYQRGDVMWIHFGFTLGINYMDYKTTLSGANDFRVEAGKMNTGFLVGVVSELRLNDDLGLRFTPGLEFSTRRLMYTTPVWKTPEDPENSTPLRLEDDLKAEENKNDHVYVTIPLLLKYKAKRINNYRPFIVAGPCLKYDFQKHKRIDPDKGIYLRTKTWDAFLEAGIGSDFYLPYFKFGIELRFSLGLTDVLIHKYDKENPGYEDYTDAVKKMKARMFTIAFHFE